MHSGVGPITVTSKMKKSRLICFQVPTEPLTGTLHLVCASDDALQNILDLDPSVAESEEFIDFVAGKYLPSGGLTVSHRCVELKAIPLNIHKHKINLNKACFIYILHKTAWVDTVPWQNISFQKHNKLNVFLS